MSIRTELKKIEKKISKLYNIEVAKKGLVDTGKLKNSFTTKIKIEKNGDINIDVFSMDYFEYIDGPYSVSDDVFNSKAYEKIETELIGLLLTEKYIDLPKSFDTKSDSVEYTFKLPK